MSSQATIRRRFQFWPYCPRAISRRLGKELPRETNPKLVDDHRYVGLHCEEWESLVFLSISVRSTELRRAAYRFKG